VTEMFYKEMKRSTRNWECASGHAHDCRDFLTILDNVLTVDKSAGSEERACRPHPPPGDRLEVAGRGAKNGVAADFAEALQQ
jgi:hypothetical protein